MNKVCFVQSSTGEMELRRLILVCKGCNYNKKIVFCAVSQKGKNDLGHLWFDKEYKHIYNGWKLIFPTKLFNLFYDQQVEISK